ncbi:MAG: HAD family hydrolase [Thiotrichales bacterium]|jgi:HAD superfamily hydrolase (TIGR01490 family)|nr:HAD family hydrolase [Thiotrichales bacterium]MBT3613396.1 HAD family hydrolase [Thiotrichales bacterium]MBT3752495.1 HAD family hydrolase [Thiotrichales bacterium]MBT3837454.1 HAD family hydrolase [Thiotrichales bacterium]MBT4151437.1 HAD family hydrolase [Thiotrichales bacterium]
MSLAIFDLDNTLIGGDSDHLWGDFLVRHNYVDREFHSSENDRFFDLYNAGKLDIYEWLEFQFKLFTDNPYARLVKWHQAFMEEMIKPALLPKAATLIESHRKLGDTLLIITATNHFITAPIAELLGIPNLIATNPEMIDGEFSGRVAGLPSYQEGKITRLNEWLGRPEQSNISMDNSSFYSDSHNDLPLLESVSRPVAVDPDDILRSTATERDWEIISLRS